MIDMAIKNIWQRKTRSALTVLGVGLAVVLYVYLSTIMSFYDRDLEQTIAGFAGKVIVQSRSDAESGFPPTASLISAEQAAAVLEAPEVDRERSSAVLFEPLVANPAPNMPPSVMAVGITPGHEFAFLGNADALGERNLAGPDEVILGANAADHYDASVGDLVTIKERELSVISVIEEQTELINNAVLMPIETAREIFARSDVVSAVMLTVQDVNRVQSVANAVEQQHEDLVASTPTEMAETANDLLEPQRVFFASVRGTIVAVGIVVVMVVMFMAVAERRRDIGTLKALGASRRHILSMILWESLVLSLTGAAGAILVAWFLTRNDSMPVDATLALQTALIAVLVGAVASLLPAWSALRVDPIESLRYE